MKTILFYVCTFVFLVSSILALQPARVEFRPYSYKPSTELHPIPRVKEGSVFPVFSAQGIFAVDLDSGVTLYEKNADAQLYPASTTKMMTALVAHEIYQPNDTITVGYVKVAGQRMHLTMGERITVSDLLDGLLIFSANDAAEVLAQNYPTTNLAATPLIRREQFIEAMNEKARALGMTGSTFKNPSGLDDPAHLTTAKDMARLASYGMKNEYFAKIVGTKSKTVTSTDGKIIHRLTNINELLGKVDGVLGVKTGWTDAARENLVTYIDRNGHRVIVVVLGSSDRFGETTELVEWIYGNYSWEDPKEEITAGTSLK